MRTHKPETGVALVEATVVIPLVIVIVVFLGSFAMAITEHALFTEGVRAAGRAAVSGFKDCDERREVAVEVLNKHLEKNGLHRGSGHPKAKYEASPQGKSQLKLEVKGKLMGLLEVDYSSVTKLEGDDAC